MSWDPVHCACVNTIPLVICQYCLAGKKKPLIKPVLGTNNAATTSAKLNDGVFIPIMDTNANAATLNVKTSANCLGTTNTSKISFMEGAVLTVKSCA